LKEYQVIIKSKFFSLLFKVDKDLSEQLKKTLSPCYGMRLHIGHYLRKIRGIDDIENAHNIKFSFNCSKCRSRFSVIGNLLASPPNPGDLKLELEKIACRNWTIL
jgi:hypothetical protein